MTSDFWTVPGEIPTPKSWIFFPIWFLDFLLEIRPEQFLDNLIEEFFPIWILDNSESLCSQPVCPWCLYIYRSLYRQTFKRILFSFSTLADCCEIQRTWDFKQFLIWIMCKCWKGIWKSTLNGSSHLSGISVISVRLITYHRPHLSFEIHFEIAYN